MKDMAAAVSMRAVSQTRIVEIACRSAIEEEARVREKQIGILVLGPMPRVGVDEQLRVRYVLSERVRIDRRDHHIIVTVHDQRRLSNFLQLARLGWVAC